MKTFLLQALFLAVSWQFPSAGLARKGFSPLHKAPKKDRLGQDYLVQLDGDQCEEDLKRFVLKLGDENDSDASPEIGGQVRNLFPKSCVLSAKLTDAQLQKIRHDHQVDTVVEDRLVHCMATKQWHLDRIDFRNVLDNRPIDINGDGTGVDVYVLDSGLDITHPEFEGRAFNLYSVYGDGGYDALGHGTHAAGLVGGKTYGVAKMCRLYGVKVLNNQGQGSLQDVYKGLTTVLNTVAQNRARGIIRPTIVNMSFGVSGIPLLKTWVQNLFANGVLMVTAAGNSGSNACEVFPGRLAETINVGAVDMQNSLAKFSNWGQCVDILAPGSDVSAAAPKYKYRVATGTSTAAPIVAGAAAVLWSLNPFMTAAEVKMAVLQSGVKIPNFRAPSHAKGTRDLIVAAYYPVNWFAKANGNQVPTITIQTLGSGKDGPFRCGLLVEKCQNINQLAQQGLFNPKLVGKWFGDCVGYACLARQYCVERGKQLFKLCKNGQQQPIYAAWTHDGSINRVVGDYVSPHLSLKLDARSTAMDYVEYRHSDLNAPYLNIGGYASQGYNLDMCKQLCARIPQCTAVVWTGVSCFLKSMTTVNQLEPSQNPTYDYTTYTKILQSSGNLAGPVRRGAWWVFYNTDVAGAPSIGGGYFDENWSLGLCQQKCLQSSSCNGFVYSGTSCFLKRFNMQQLKVSANADQDVQWDLWMRA